MTTLTPVLTADKTTAIVTVGYENATNSTMGERTQTQATPMTSRRLLVRHTSSDGLRIMSEECAGVGLTVI
jgi:hypothetical protein